MTNGYKFIDSFFRAVLAQSTVIRGRFFMAPKYGSELNNDEMEQLTDAYSATKPTFPAAILMPPRIVGQIIDENGWLRYSIGLYFLTTTFYNGAGQVKSPSAATGKSGVDVVSEWDAMADVAINFLRIIKDQQRSAGLLNNTLRLVDGARTIEPVSFVGTNRLSGVRLDFSVSLFNGCEWPATPPELIPGADPAEVYRDEWRIVEW
jgi:hypothetical protein